MAFEGLSDKLQNAFKKLSGRGKLTEADVKAAMREVRMALLEADVNYAIVKDFVKTVTERCVGAEILESLTPSQQVIKIVNEELTKLMGGVNAKLTHSPTAPTIYMMCGLQGAGKTTMCAKLGRMLKKENKRPLLVACDVYRPAAIRQLQIVGSQAGVEVYERGQGNPVHFHARAGRGRSKRVVGLYYAVGVWNSYFDAMVYLSSRNKMPLTVFLREILILNDSADMTSSMDVESMITMQERQRVMKYSLIVVSSVPMFILYPFVQKYFVQGIMIGSVKG